MTETTTGITEAATPQIHHASGVNTRISQGEYGNLSLAESGLNLKRAKSGDSVVLFSLPAGVRIYGLRLYGSASVENISIAGHTLCNAVDVCAGALTLTPWTSEQPDQLLILTLKTVPENASLNCVLEYVAQGSL